MPATQGLLRCAVALAIASSGGSSGQENDDCDAADGGGWSRAHEPHLAWGWSAQEARLSPEVTPPCPWRRVTVAELGHFDGLEPAIITGLQEGPAPADGGAWAAQTRWTRAALLRLYGSEAIRVGDALEMGRAGPDMA